MVIEILYANIPDVARRRRYAMVENYSVYCVLSFGIAWLQCKTKVSVSPVTKERVKRLKTVSVLYDYVTSK